MREMLRCFFCFILIPTVHFSQTGEIIGVVLDRETKQPLPGVTVVLDDTLGVSTDSTGKYWLICFPGNHLLSFRMMGYKTMTRQIAIDDSEAKIINVELFADVKQLGTVVVSAGKFEQRIEEVTVSMAVLSADQVTAKNPVTMEEAIELCPGLTVIDGQANIRGGSGFSYGAGSRVLMLVDDLPMLTADAGDVKWSFLPLENLNQVEVIKGAASALYGSSALNGVINFRTVYPGEKPVTKINLFSAMFDDPEIKKWKWAPKPRFQYGATVSHSQKINNLDFFLAQNYFKDDGYRQGETEERIRMNTNLRYRFKKIPGLTAGVNSNFQRAAGGVFFLWGNDTTDALEPLGGIGDSSTTISYYTTYRFNVDPFITYFDSKGNQHKLRTRYFQTDNQNNTNQESTGKVYYAEYQFQKKFNEFVTWTAGGVETYTTVESELYENHTGNNIAFYSQLDANVKRFNYSFGVRWEKHRLDTVETEFVPVFRSGLNYELLKNTHLRISYGQGYRYPSVAEKFIRTNVGSINIYPNDSIREETGWTAEIGINQGFSIAGWEGNLDVAGFWQQYDNMLEFTFGQFGNIFTDPFFGLGFKSVNIGNTRIKGIDVTLYGDGKIGNVSVKTLAGYTYIDPKEIDFDQNTDTIRNSVTYNILKYRYRHLAKADLELGYKNFGLGTGMRYNSYMQNIDKFFEEFIAGVKHYRQRHNYGDWIFDSRISYTFSGKLRLAFIVKNIFNHEYVNRPADPQAPRTFLVQAGITL